MADDLPSRIDDLIRIFRSLRRKLEEEKKLLLGDTLKKYKVAKQWEQYADQYAERNKKDLRLFEAVWPGKPVMKDC
jgi:hypothetical protein